MFCAAIWSEKSIGALLLGSTESLLYYTGLVWHSITGCSSSHYKARSSISFPVLSRAVSKVSRIYPAKSAFGRKKKIALLSSLRF